MTLTAEVESTGRAYTAGRVSAVLMVEKVDGKAVHFRVECASLPKCEAGGRIRGRFSLDVPDATQRLDDYADGIVLSAEYLCEAKMIRKLYLPYFLCDSVPNLCKKNKYRKGMPGG